MRIKSINDVNQVFGFEVCQDQKQPREKLSERSREPTFSTHKWRQLPCTLVEDEFSKPLLKSVFIIFTYSSILS